MMDIMYLLESYITNTTYIVYGKVVARGVVLYHRVSEPGILSRLPRPVKRYRKIERSEDVSVRAGAALHAVGGP